MERGLFKLSSQFPRKQRKTFLLTLVLAMITSLFSATPARAAITSVNATGVSPTPCNQSGSNLGSSVGNVTAERLAGGDCLVKFISPGSSYSWNVPYNVTSISVLVVGAGGGGGGGGYSNQGSGGGGGGGGGGGQVTQTTINNLLPNQAKGISVGSGGAGATFGGTGGSSWGGYHGRDGGSSSFDTTAALGGKAGFGGGIWGFSSTSPSTCNDTRVFSHDGISIYYIDGIGGKGGANGNSTYAGALPYCTTDSTVGRGGSGGGGGGAGVSASNLTSTTGTPNSAATGATNNWTGASVEYGTGGAGGAGGIGNPTMTVGATGSRPGMGGSGGTGSRADNSSSTGALGGAGAAGIVMIRYTPDTTAPTFSSASAFDINENIASSTTAATIKSTESATITITATGDYLDFSISQSDSVTALIKFAAIPNFERPDDSGGDNTYNITLNATDVNGNIGSQAISIRVLDINENPGISGSVYKGVETTITITVGSVGKVRFFVNGKRITNCLSRSTTGTHPNITASCSWKPSVQGRIAITATTTPTNLSLPTETSNPTYVTVLRRTTSRR